MPPELDGRWRYVMYDVDWTLGLYGGNPSRNAFDLLVGNTKQSPLLAALLKRPDTARRFAALVCDIADSVVSVENVTRYANALYNESKKEINVALAAKKYAHWVNTSTILQNHDEMASFAKSRSDTVYKFFQNRYGYGNMFDIVVQNGEAVLNTQVSSYNRYFNNINVPISPALPRFGIFDYWLVNGEQVDEPDLLLSGKDAVGGRVFLKMVYHTEPPALVFEYAYSDRMGNGCTLTNLTETAAVTKGLFLSDSPDNPLYWALPEVSVAPGKIMALAGKGSANVNDLLKVQMPFRVESGSVLLLSDSDGNVLDYITVP
jgi:hypothetical protein